MLVAMIAALVMMTEPAPESPMLASSLEWQAHFAKHPSDPRVILTLMSIGGFLAPTSPTHDHIIHELLDAHPKAVVVKVGDMGSWRTDAPDAHMYYVWLVDGGSNLNLHLIELGDCAGPTMEVPATNKLLVSEAEYKGFLEKAVLAHRTAQEK